MERRTLRALGGRDILPGKRYLLVRVTPGLEVVVNAITVETRPTYRQECDDSFFMASCQHIFQRPLTEAEGAAIELSLSDIGCARNAPKSGVLARTFTYGLVEHEMLSTEVWKNPQVWRQHLHDGCKTIHYMVSSPAEAGFSLQGGSASATTALSRWVWS